MAKGSVVRAVEFPVSAVELVPSPPLRLDIGCGKTTPDGWVGIDQIDFGQAWRADLSSGSPWVFQSSVEPPQCARISAAMPHWDGAKGGETGEKTYIFSLPDSSVDEVRSSHFVEHLTGNERVAFFNELWRVMKPDATALIITPNWSHACAYGDPTHQWPPMSQWWPLYLHKDWRAANAPHAPYTCHFDHVIAASWDGAIESRNPEFKQFAMNNYTNSMRDLIVTLTCRK